MSTLSDLLNPQSRGASTHDKSLKFANSVLLRLPKFSKNYQPEDFIKALDGVVERSEIRVLGRLKFPNEWSMTLSNEDARERLFQRGHFLVKGKKCVVHPQAMSEVRGRIHWLPGELGDDKIRSILERFGEVLSFKKEMVFRTPQELRSSVRSFSLFVKPDVKIDDIPHFIKINDHEGLVTIKNRDPICLGCKEHGHRKSRCPNSTKKFISKKRNKKNQQSTSSSGGGGGGTAAKETGAKKKKKAKKKPAVEAAAATAEEIVVEEVAPVVPSSNAVVAEIQKNFNLMMKQMVEHMKANTPLTPPTTNDQATAAKANKKPIKKEPTDASAAGPSNTPQVIKREGKKEPVSSSPVIKQEIVNGSGINNQGKSAVPTTQGAVGGGSQVSATIIATNNASNEKVGSKKKKNKKKKVHFVAAE